MLLLLIGLLGSLSAVLAVVNHNRDNEFRGEAMRIAQTQMDELRNVTTPTVATTTVTVNRTIRKGTVPYTVTTAIALNNGFYLMTVTVGWTAGKRSRTYVLNSVR